MTDSCQLTSDCLGALQRGDPTAADRLLPLVYDELHALAAAWLQRERPDHTLQPTALVNEVYLRLVHQDSSSFNDRIHFFAVAAEAVRRVLVDHARRHRAAKRGAGWERITLTDLGDVRSPPAVDLLALDDALERLRHLSPRQHDLVRLRFFGGLTGAEAADVLGISRATAATDWATAKAWLLTELAPPDAAP